MPRVNHAARVAKASAETGDRGVFRGNRRGNGAPLMKLSITLPKDVVLKADAHVLERKGIAGSESFNRSALIEEALRAYLAD